MKRLTIAATVLAMVISPRMQGQIYVEIAPLGNLSSLTCSGTPIVGSGLSVSITGEPGSIAYLGKSSFTASMPTPGGFILLGLSDLELYSTSIGPTGVLTLVCPALPPNPIGTEINLQAIVQSPSGIWRLSNRVRIFYAGSLTMQPPAIMQINPVVSPTAATQATLNGRAVFPSSEIRIVGGVTPVVVQAGGASANAGFTATVDLQPNRLNVLYLTETPSNGPALPPVTVQVIQDSQPPELIVDHPMVGAGLTEPTVTVLGRVSDALSGFAGLTVSVNGQNAVVNPGIGTNGTFELSNVSLGTVGTTTVLNIFARDAVANTITIPPINVTRVAVQGPVMSIVSGENQQASIREQLAQPIVVEVRRVDGSPFANKFVQFQVASNDGQLTSAPTGPESAIIQVATNAQGRAQAYWRLGGTAGCGNNRVSVTSGGIGGAILFCASALAGPPSQINVSAGNDQRVATGAVLPQPLRAWVSDGCNPVGNVPVIFSILRGNGHFLTSTGTPVGTAVVLTSNTGHASTRFVAGSIQGNDIVESTFAGNPNPKARFFAFSVPATANGTTDLAGLVQDNAGRPLGGATCELEIGGISFGQVQSDIEGRFLFDDLVSNGPGHLKVNGSTATSVGGQPVAMGSYPELAYEVLIVPGAENSLSTAVLLPPLTNPAVAYNPAAGNILTIPSIAGLKFTIAPNSMRISGPSGPLLAPAGTALSLNQVHVDKIPMPIPDGAGPLFTWTLQPHGATFEPPIKIEYPNMTGLPPNGIAFFLSFDHDVNEFQIVASGHVTSDGSLIITDEGDGLRTAGWGCNCPPYLAVSDCQKCSDTCQPGQFIGVSASSNPTSPDLGQSITFSANAAVTGGTILRTCPDGTTSSSPAPAPSISWTYDISGPDSFQQSGTGNSTSVVASSCGTYTCVFTATATGACAPPPASTSTTATVPSTALHFTNPPATPVTSNNFVFDLSNPANLSLTLSVNAPPMAMVGWSLPSIPGMALTTTPSPPNTPSVQLQFQGSLTSNAIFGPRSVSATLGSCSAMRDIEIFYPLMGTNNPGGNPNWYFFWSAALGVTGQHTYDGSLPTSETVVSSATSWTIKIGSNAHWSAAGNAPTGQMFINGFWASNLHEFWHRDHRVHNFVAHGAWDPPASDDIDGDGICDRESSDPAGFHGGGWEAIIGTNPMVINSTEEGANWAELNGTYNHQTRDWASPGSQSNN